MIAIAHGPDEAVQAGAAVVVLEAMKMEHEVVADADGNVDRIDVAVGDTVDEGQLLAVLRPGAAAAADGAPTAAVDLDAIRDDLAAVRERHALTLDAARPELVARRHGRGRQMARENLSELMVRGGRPLLTLLARPPQQHVVVLHVHAEAL